MALQTLKPKLKPIATNKVRVLEAKAGTTERVRGRAWVKTRKRVAHKGNYRCAGCQRVWLSYKDQVDHVVPLEQQGSNDDDNLQLLCNECHKDKTKAEATARAGGAGSKVQNSL